MRVERKFQDAYEVLIPMWWGGFSEASGYTEEQREVVVLIPMWWGGFSEKKQKEKELEEFVLIPMWWGGFSEI